MTKPAKNKAAQQLAYKRALSLSPERRKEISEKAWRASRKARARAKKLAQAEPTE